MQVTLGSTGITVNKNGFGCLPIQRVGFDEAARLLRRGYAGGITFFDTARAYSDSEEKMGRALAEIRTHIYLATKTMHFTPEGFWEDLHTSLRLLRTDYIDLYQFHNPSFCPLPGDGTGLYECMTEAKAQGLIRHIGITNHSLAVARQAIDSGCYETLQFPFSYLSGEQELALVEGCKRANMGFIAMKALSGGLITNARAAYAFMTQFDNVLPIWGVQRDWELEQFLACDADAPELDAALRAVIEADRRELAGNFCRGCGYCMPCPQGIVISNCARMIQLLRRSPSAGWLSPEWQARMEKIDTCIHCNQCMKKCPYKLNTPALLAENLKDYREVLAGKPL